MTSVMMVLTGSDVWTLKDGTEHPCGFWSPELVDPHQVFVDAGFDVTIATPGGVPTPVDEASFRLDMNGGDEQRVQYLKDYLAKIQDELDHPAKLEDVDSASFDVLFIPGGHGPMEDLAVSEAMGDLLAEVAPTDKIIGAVCHGTAALFPAKNQDGSWVFSGYTLTGFSNVEEGQVGFADKAAWLLEDRLRNDGAKYVSGEPWAAFTTTDRNVMTGQNPASGDALAKEIVDRVS